MNLLILHASPKKKGGASRSFSRSFRLFLPGIRKKAVSLSGRQDFQQVLELFPDMDAVCLFVPLYVDSLPSHVIEFLIQAESYCKSHPCRFRLYALSHNGFVEGKQNRPTLHILQAWCERAGISWGGGIGVGGGVMLQVLGVVYPILVGVILLQMALAFFSGGTVPGELWRSLVIQMCIWLFLSSGMLFCMARFCAAVRGERSLANQFTRVMVPSFLFIPIADLFMVVSSLFHGRFFFTLLKRDKWSDE